MSETQGVKMNAKDRAHEWLADHVKGVQYPNAYRGMPKEKHPFFKHKMPWHLRLGLVCLLVPLIIFLGMIAFASGGAAILAFYNMIFG